ncbi:MAG: ABC transporter ATP-binding protein [Anaerolineae bacterium]|nr:ABC transporter ATP-binding protein [Anaerolineae bacterium]
MTFLKIDSICKTYDGAPLLRDVSLNVDRGETISLLGASGSGKTTLLRIIAGLEASESGRVLLDGRDVTHIPVHRRGVVLMFQEYALFPHRTVAENVGFGLRMQGRPRSEIQARVSEMLRLVGLAGLEERSVVQLSGGERQRVALARSLAPEPRLLLLDEPLGSLDRNLRERLLEDLAVILRRVGVTSIVVTHDQTEAFSLANRVALLHDACVVQVGAPETIYRRPASPWVARFLGLTNLLPAVRVARDQVDTALGSLSVGSAQWAVGPGHAVGYDRGTVLIPPWGIHLVDEDAPVNVFAATVSHATFQGRTTELRLRIGEATLAHTLELMDGIPVVGDAVRVWIDPGTLCWFQSDPESPPDAVMQIRS